MFHPLRTKTLSILYLDGFRLRAFISLLPHKAPNEPYFLACVAHLTTCKRSRVVEVRGRLGDIHGVPEHTLSASLAS